MKVEINIKTNDSSNEYTLSPYWDWLPPKQSEIKINIEESKDSEIEDEVNKRIVERDIDKIKVI